MRNKAAIILFATLGALLFAAGQVKAQTLVDGDVRANVPFSFYAGNTQFPAGNYRISQLDPADPNELLISTTDGKISALIEVDQSNKPSSLSVTPPAKTTELSFDKYGNRYFLSGMSVLGLNTTVNLQKSRLETLVSKGEVPGEGRHVAGTKVKRNS